MKKVILPFLAVVFVAGCSSTGTSDGNVRIPAGTETLRLTVGQTKHLDAYRGKNCSAGAPSWESVKRRLPKSSIVSYSDGGQRTRNSKSCGRVVPTRAVDATGIAVGTELNRYSNPIAIIVE